jgi:predicted Fe-Mo cluster-binding NifX family protein
MSIVFIPQDEEMHAMKIAVSSSGTDLTSPVDPRFGRADFFVIVDAESMDVKAIENVQHLNLPQGAGIQAAKTVAAEKVDALITGNCGPKAFRVLQAAGIQVVTGARGRIDEVIRRYQNGEFETADAANVQGHWV